MCLITFGYKVHPQFELIVLANRDEFTNRGFLQAHHWGSRQKVISGIDLTAKGGWTGITESGRIAIVTNYRNGLKNDSELSSRGGLVTNFLDSDISAKEYLGVLRRSKDYYNGYNIIFGCADSLYWYSNINDKYILLQPGFYGLSNHLLDTEWPKLKQVKSKLKAHIESDQICPNELQAIMLDNHQFDESQLPDTGIDLELEKGLSPVFVDLGSYGTILTTIIYLRKDFKQLLEFSHLDENSDISPCYSSTMFTVES